MFDQNNTNQSQDNQIKIATPVVENGVEFYSSKISNERGISQAGLARLCGVDERTVRRLLGGLSVRGYSPSEALNHLLGTELYCGISSNQQAKVVKSSVAASIVTYYALERNNTTSLLSLQLFAVIGFDSWIDKVTANQPAQTPLNYSNDIHELLKQIMAEVLQLKESNQNYSRVKERYPALETWLKNLNEQATGITEADIVIVGNRL
jgi:transcriptional regulator with XRE-family HTH domain